MPRARPGARKTTARRRIQRYRSKWTHHVIPERLKRLLSEPPHHMWEEWEDKEKSDSPGYVECEEPTMAELETKGVPEAEWPYYLGYMKRMLALYRAYTAETLQLEKTNLIEEYVLRGKTRDVLNQVQEVAAECAGVPYVPPPEFCPSGEQIVNGGFETGDFTGWTIIGDCPGKCEIRVLHPHSGMFCAYLRYDWDCGCGIEQTLTEEIPVFCVSAFSCWIYRLAGGTAYILITYTDDTTTLVAREIGAFVWVEFDMLGDLVAGKIVKSIRIYRYTNGAVNYIDDVSLVGSGAELP